MKPYLYLNWVRKAWSYGLGQLFDDAWLLWPLALLAVSLPLLALLGLGAGRPPPGPAAGPDDERARARVLLGLLVAALVYFGCYMVLVCMVAYPIPRYTIACTFLLPPAVCALLFESWRQIARRLPAR